MNIKEIFNEGIGSAAKDFALGVGKALLPKGVQAAIDAKKPQARIDDYEAAKLAHQNYGVNSTFDTNRFYNKLEGLPDELVNHYKSKAGEISWYNDWQLAKEYETIANIKTANKELAQEPKPSQDEKIRAALTAQGAFQDIFGRPFTGQEPEAKQKPSAATKPTTPAKPPPQVKLPSGEYITNYGGNWYNEKSERIVIPADIERLNRMAAGPSGQAGMASTKNIPVDLPGYKGKRR